MCRLLGTENEYLSREQPTGSSGGLSTLLDETDGRKMDPIIALNETDGRKMDPIIAINPLTDQYV